MTPDFEKTNGLVPAIIQDNRTLQVLMLGYMNEDALRKTEAEGKVTFFSRSKQRLWTKGESSGNFLYVNDIQLDCDNDTLLIKATPAGPACHLGTTTCFGEPNAKGFLYALEETIRQRIESNSATSYTNKIYRKGLNKMAQKVGEEAVEVVIEAMDTQDDLFKNETADLLYHLLILLYGKGFALQDIEAVLQERAG